MKKTLPVAASFVMLGASAAICGGVVATGRSIQAGFVVSFLAAGAMGLVAHLLGYEPEKRYPKPAPATPIPVGRPFRPVEPERDEVCPYPWVAPAVWRQRKQSSRSGGSYAGMDERQDGGPDAEVIQVRGSPVRLPGLPAPPAMSPDQAQQALERMEQPVGIWWEEGQWPYCCGALTVLALVAPTDAELAEFERKSGALDGCEIGELPREGWLEMLTHTRSGHPPDVAAHVYVCARCGGVYGRYTHT